MNSSWLLTGIAVVGCVKLLIDTVLAIGRWTKKVEIGNEQKPKVTLERLSWDIEQISKDIRELRTHGEGRYAELSARVTSDHQQLREVLNWKAGIYAELAQHFYSIPLIDRMFKEGEKDRAGIHVDIDLLKEKCFAQRAGDKP